MTIQDDELIAVLATYFDEQCIKDFPNASVTPSYEHWRQKATPIIKLLRPHLHRASHGEISVEWWKKVIDTVAVNSGMTIEVNNIVPPTEIWFTDKNNKVVGKIKHINMVNEKEQAND